jgi:predicted nucleotidyltransferase
MEDKKDNITKLRTEFSDFVIQCTIKYFSSSNINDIVRDEMRKQELLIIPFGSVLRGNANEEKSDLDLFFVTLNSSNVIKASLSKLTEGEFHDGISLGKYIISEYKKRDPDIVDKRINNVSNEYVEEMETDFPLVSLDDLISSINKGEVAEVPTGGRGHSSAVIIGTILRANYDYVVYEGTNRSHGIMTSRIQAALSAKDEDDTADLIDKEYNHFLSWNKDEK